jgi:hypothetical protein
MSMKNKILNYFIEGKTGGEKYGDFVVKDGKMLFNRVGGLDAKYQDNDRAPERRGVWAFPYPIFEWFFVGSKYSSPSVHSPKKEKKIKLDDKTRRELEKRLKGLKNKYEIGISKLIPTKDNPRPVYWGDEKYEIETIEDALSSGEYDPREMVQSLKHKYKGSHKIRKFFWGGAVWARFAPKNEKVNDKGWYRYDNIYLYINELRKHLINYTTAKQLWGGDEEKLQKLGVNIVGGKDFNLSSDHLEVFIPMRAES